MDAKSLSNESLPNGNLPNGCPFPRGMRVVGLTGGIASGKTVVAKAFEDLGAVRLDADRAGHAVLDFADVVEALRDRWGNAVITTDGNVRRPEVAKRVFDPVHGPQERAFLEQLTHPRIARLLGAEADRAAAAGCRIAVLDAALLFEANWDRACDLVVFVDAPRPTRLARALSRGWSETDFANREAAQFSVDFKRERADEVIDNSGSLNYVHSQVERLWHARLEDD